MLRDEDHSASRRARGHELQALSRSGPAGPAAAAADTGHEFISVIRRRRRRRISTVFESTTTAAVLLHAPATAAGAAVIYADTRPAADGAVWGDAHGGVSGI